MGDTLPENDRDLQDRCWTIENILSEDPGAERELTTCLLEIRQDLGTLMIERYGPDPEIDRFCQGIEGLRDCRIEGLKD